MLALAGEQSFLSALRVWLYHEKGLSGKQNPLFIEGVLEYSFLASPRLTALVLVAVQPLSEFVCPRTEETSPHWCISSFISPEAGLEQSRKGEEPPVPSDRSHFASCQLQP